MINTLRNISLSLLLLGSVSSADTMHENASDGDTVGWHIYDSWPSGASIDNIIDSETGNRVIKITGTTSNGVQFLGWHDTNSILQWKMKADKWNVFYIAVMTSNGSRYLSYTPRNHDVGRDPYHQSHKIRLGLGSKMMDGEWHTFTRDIQADITKHEPGNQLEYIQGIKIRGAGSYDNIKTISNSTNNLESIFIIGPSTVSASGYISRDGSGRTLEGWGEELDFYMKDKNKLFNRARSGSTATDPANPSGNCKVSYMRVFDCTLMVNGVDRFAGMRGFDWDDTKQRIVNNNDTGFLLIQFGANDKVKKISENDYKSALRIYIDEARALNLTPVLITSLNSRVRHNARGDYPKYTKEVATEKSVLLLDLNKRSVDEWKGKYTASDEIIINGVYRIPKADRKFGYENYDGVGINNTHMSPSGAKIVAGWVKELACEQSNTSDVAKKLCAQFK